MADPWWASELLRRREDLIGFLEARAGLSHATARDTVDALGAELAERFQRDRRDYPVEWFGEGAPGAGAAAAYAELLRTVALRRGYDQLRAEYRRKKLLPALEAHLRNEGPEPSVERTVDARKFLSALAAELEKLEPAERELLLRADRLGPASGRERIRLHRLRRRLAAAVKEDLLK